MFRLKGLTTIGFFFLILQFSCRQHEQGAIDPPSDDSLLHYRWEADTIFFVPYEGAPKQTLIRSMWGISDSNVYAVGHDLYNGRGSMWRFDGKVWNRIKLFAYEGEGGPLTQAFSLHGILGVSQNQIYAFGEKVYSNSSPLIDSTLLIQFDGTVWREIKISCKGVLFHGISERNNITIGGSNGIIFNFRNNAWNLDTLENELFPEIPLYVRVVGPSANGVYAVTHKFIQSIFQGIYQLILIENGKHTILDTTNSSYPRWGFNSFWVSNSNKLYSAGYDGLYCFNGIDWAKIKSSNRFVSITGTDDSNMFAMDIDGNLHNFDGVSWKVVGTLPGAPIFSAQILLLKNSIFISMQKDDYTVIYRGYE